MWPLAFGCH
jgi:hypothetical protein